MQALSIVCVVPYSFCAARELGEDLGDYQSYDVWTSGSSSLYFRLQESGSSGLTSIQDVGQHTTEGTREGQEVE